MELGEEHHLHLVLEGGEPLLAKLPGSSTARRGDAVPVASYPARGCLFD